MEVERRVGAPGFVAAMSLVARAKSLVEAGVELDRGRVGRVARPGVS